MQHLYQILQKDCKKIVISSFVFVGLFLFVTPAHALFGVADFGIFDLAAIQLDALDFVENVIIRMIIFILVLVAESEVFIVVSAALLQWAVNFPIELKDNLLVTMGWEFTRGIVNIMFILIFSFIALSSILRLETFSAKKALPRLIIIALLVNFSLLFVGIIVDIGTILQNTLSNAFGGNFVNQAIEPLKASLSSVAVWLAAIPLGYLALSSIPYVNVISLIGIGIFALNDILSMGHIANILTLIVVNFLVGTIFLMYFVLFLFRVVIIWILAISAPLAFMAFILPATEKYFKSWFKYLLSWSLIGVVAFFLIGLGLKLFSTFASETPFIAITTGSPPLAFSYIFLIVYMAVAFFVSKKFVPQGANIIMQQGGALIGQATRAGLKMKTTGRAAEGLRNKLKDVSEWGEGKSRPAQIASSLPNRLVGSQLLRYSARSRQFTIPPEFDGMSSDEQTDFLKLQRKDGDRLKISARMIKNDTMKFSPEAEDITEKDAEALVKNESQIPYFRAEVAAWMDYAPDRISKDMKIMFEVDGDSQTKMKKKIEAAENELRDKIDDPDDITIETALKLKYITEDYVATNRNNAILKAQRSMGAGEEDAFIENAATAMVHSRGLKANKFDSMQKESVGSLGVRIGLHKQILGAFQRIHENFDSEIEDKIFNGIGGINTMANNPDKSDKFYWQNPSLFRSFVNTAAGQQLPFEGRGHMRIMTEAGSIKPTEHFDEYRKDWLDKGTWSHPTKQPTPGNPPPGWSKETPAPEGWKWHAPSPPSGGTTTPPPSSTPPPSGGTPPPSSTPPPSGGTPPPSSTSPPYDDETTTPGKAQARPARTPKPPQESIITPLNSVKNWARRKNQEGLIANEKNLEALVAEVKEVHIARLKNTKPNSPKPNWAKSVDTAFDNLTRKGFPW
ncbi:MAG: type IV secretion system protein [Patescibacteria group bacterium]|nr:type IV secretion system protein [Patescibacteria group bacterium]